MARRSPVDRLLLLVLALVPLALVRPTLAPMSDPDVFWHILGGDHVLGTGQLVGADPLPSLADRPWVKHQWLGDVVLSLSHRIGGLPAVQWWTSAAAIAIFAALLWSTRQRGETLPAALASLLAWGACSASIGPRPQVVSFVLVAVTLGAWRGSRRDGRARWWLVPMTWVWACVHGMWFLGPLVGALEVAGVLWTTRHDAPARARVLRLLAIPLLSTIAAGATPLGIEVYRAPFLVSQVTAYITEWARPTLTDTAPLLGLALLALAVGPWALRGHRPTLTDLLVAALASYLLFAHARTVGLAAILLAPLAADHLQRVVLRRAPRTAPLGRTLAAGSALALLLAAVVLPRVADRPSLIPAGLGPAIEALPARTVVFDDSLVGGWLLFAHPRVVVGIDTRVELYDPAYVGRYADALAGRGTVALVGDIGAGAAILEAQGPAARALVADGWTELARDRGFVLLRPTPAPAT